MSKTKSNQSVIVSAMKMALGTFSSRILGLVRDSVLGALFDRTITDAFVVAFRLPNFFRRFLGEGSLNVSFVPVYVELIHQDEVQQTQNAQKLSNSIYTLLSLTASIVTILGVIFMEPVMSHLVGSDEFAGVPGKLELTILFARIMFSYLYLVSTYAYFMSIANSVGAFFLPALAPALFNLCTIVVALMPNFSERWSGINLAYGVLIGGLVQAGLVFFQLWQLKVLPSWTRKIRVPGLRLVLKNMVPGLVGLGVLQIISLINVYYAGQLPEGSHTYLYYGDRLLELPQSLLAISLGTALLPSLSGFVARGNHEGMLKEAARYMRVLMYMALPCSVGLFLLAEPIVRLLFGRGAFMESDILATSEVVRIYSGLLLATSFRKVIVPSFYALKDTITPAIISVFVVASHIILAPILLPIMGLAGLSLSVTVSGVVNVVLLLVVYKKKVGDLYGSKLLLLMAKCLPAIVGLTLISLAYFPITNWTNSVIGAASLKRPVESFVLGIVIFLAALAYFTISSFCGIEESKLIRSRLFEKFSRRWQKRKQ
ncbi:MAG: murein biosynthesis integral membrane protein MurJ [Bdellovibrionales bacterium]|nr:murein biosynthesis integral membrane protein MurJ [Bdellovibrionales bacterium]